MSQLVSGALLVWSALWRAQAAHICIFVLLPGLVALLHFSVGVVFLPFLLIGEGERTLTLGEQVNHLVRAGCWVALMPCDLAERTVFDLPSQNMQAPSTAAQNWLQPEPEPFIPLPTSFTLRHAWFIAWLVWFLVFLARRRRFNSEA
jgi:hypothetical protein